MYSQQFETMQKLGKDQLEVATQTFSAASKSAQTVAVEVADYAKRAFETGSSTFEKLLGARTMDRAIEIQTDYARTAYEAFVGHATRLGEVYANFAREAGQPLQGFVSQAQASFQQAGEAAARAVTPAKTK
jgi:hypothetical protein